MVLLVDIIIGFSSPRAYLTHPRYSPLQWRDRKSPVTSAAFLGIVVNCERTAAKYTISHIKLLTHDWIRMAMFQIKLNVSL